MRGRPANAGGKGGLERNVGRKVKVLAPKPFDKRGVEAEQFWVDWLFSWTGWIAAQIPNAQQLIPLPIDNELDSDETNAKSDLAIYEYEPEESDVMEDLLPLNLNIQVFQGLLENAASEQGSRMSAMDNATRNAGEMVEKLTIEYNRSRQAAITKELIEIISGAESL